jgi:hypothetical protein
MTAESHSFTRPARAPASGPALDLDPSSPREAVLTPAGALVQAHDGCHLQWSTSASSDPRVAEPAYEHRANWASTTNCSKGLDLDLGSGCEDL